MKTRTMSDGEPTPLKEKEIAFLKDWVRVRDALKVAYKDQLSDGPWETSLAALRKAYDEFVAKHGRLRDFTITEREKTVTDDDGNVTTNVTVSKRFKNDPLLRLDVEGVLAHALEKIDEVAGTIAPDKVLSERVLEKRRPPEIKTVQDALFVSLDGKGTLDIDHVAALAGLPRAEAIAALGPEIYEAPNGTWETADRYLSGDVRKALKDAQAAAALDKRFNRNVEALLTVQPRPLGPAEISVNLGQNWIAPNHVSDFASDVMGEKLTVRYIDKIARWTVDAGYGRTYGEYNTPKMSAADILEAILNNREIKITEKDRDAVQAKLNELGISTIVYYPIPQDRLPVYAGQFPAFENSEILAKQVISLPIWPQISDEQQVRVVEGVKTALL
jgi:N12 class adenine-specific DNA methylase